MPTFSSPDRHSTMYTQSFTCLFSSLLLLLQSCDAVPVNSEPSEISTGSHPTPSTTSILTSTNPLVDQTEASRVLHFSATSLDYSSPNLIVDGDFETGSVSPWDYYNAYHEYDTISIQNTTYTDEALGSHVLQLKSTLPRKHKFDIYRSVPNVTFGSTYQIQFDAYFEWGLCDVFFGLGPPVSHIWPGSDFGLLTWKTVSTTFTAAFSDVLVFGIQDCHPSTGTLLVDNMSLRLVNV